MTKVSKKNKGEQEKLLSFLARRHPDYQKTITHWEFLVDCYEGGREWFNKNIFRYIKEGDKEYAERVNRAYRFNHTREVVDLVDKYLFKMQVARNLKDAPDFITNFIASATLNKVSMEDFMKQVSKKTSIYGRIWIVVDNNKLAVESETVSTGALSVADAKSQDIRAYVYYVTPENAVDMSYDDDGQLNWILLHEQIRDDADPINSSGEILHRFRLWEKDSWTLYTLRPNGNKKPTKMSATQLAKSIVNVAQGITDKTVATIDMQKSVEEYDVETEGPIPHEFGSVPVFHADNVINSELYKSQSLIDDVAYLDRAVANYLSNLDAIIQDQTFSQLIIPAQGILPGEEGYDKITEMGTKRIFTYDGEGGNKPEYISPDVRQAEIILKVIGKIINEIYHSIGLAGERTKEDNALGVDNSSGVAKAYDFERVNSLLASKADSLEQTENKIINMVKRWNGEEVSDVERFSEYPQNFDVRGLYDEFEIATNLNLIGAPAGVSRLQMEAVIEKLFPKMDKITKEKIMTELKTWKSLAQVTQEAADAAAPSVQGQANTGPKTPQTV